MVAPLKNILRTVTVIFTVAACCLLPATYCFSADRYVRVAIIPEIESIRLSVNGPYSIIDARDRKILSSGKFLAVTVACSKAGIAVGSADYNTNRLFIQPDGPQIVAINGKRYRGNVLLIKRDNLRLLVVNDIELEDYVKGILYHEVSHYWPQEALKAQAIVCRTYALYQMAENSGRDYDVTGDIYSQVYGGRASERYRTNMAVDETKGTVLVYNGNIFPAYFHATCGGNTENAALLWNIDLPPLRGVVCGFCQRSPHFKWYRVIALEELKDTLAKAGYRLGGDIQAIEISGTTDSGRVKELKLQTTKDTLVISAKDFRNTLGPNSIKSTNFKVSISGSDAVFEGIGWGHGVGMCQWGAYFMAKDGRSFQDILKYYYPGAELSQY